MLYLGGCYPVLSVQLLQRSKVHMDDHVDNEPFSTPQNLSHTLKVANVSLVAVFMVNVQTILIRQFRPMTRHASQTLLTYRHITLMRRNFHSDTLFSRTITSFRRIDFQRDVFPNHNDLYLIKFRVLHILITCTYFLCLLFVCLSKWTKK